MASVDLRPYRYQGKIKFDVPGVDAPIEAGFGSGGAGKGSTPYGDWPITQFNPHTPKWDLEGFALNNIYGRMPDPQYSDGRSDVMLHLDPKGRTLDQIKSLGCLSVDPKDWPALRDEIISLQKQGYSLVAHVDQTGQVTIRQSDGTTATPVASASAFADVTRAARAPIRDLQTSLAKAGFDPGKVDGIQGPQTTAAVKAFQQANGLKADGIVGPQTSTVLAASTGQRTSASTPPRLPASAIAPRLGVDNTLSYGQRSGITPAAKLAAAQSSHQDFGLGALSDPRTAALLAPTRMPPSLAAAGQVTAMPQSVGIHGAASLSAPTPVAPPIPMPGRPAALNSVPAPAPRPTVTVNPLPSAYTLNPTAMVDAAKKAGVISGPASWLPDQTIWNGAFGQQGMRDRIAAALPQGSSLDPKTNTVHVADPQALANSYLQKVPSLFRPMAQEAVAPAIHYAESAGFVQPQWPPSQTFPMPVPRPAMPVAPSAPATIQVLNPAYTAWQASQTPALKAGQAYTATGSIIPQSMADAMRAVSGSAYQQPIARQAAPPRFITQTVRAPVPMSRPLSFFAQPQVAAPRQVVAAPVQQQSAAQRVNAFSDKPFGSPFW